MQVPTQATVPTLLIPKNETSEQFVFVIEVNPNVPSFNRVDTAPRLRCARLSSAKPDVPVAINAQPLTDSRFL